MLVLYSSFLMDALGSYQSGYTQLQVILPRESSAIVIVITNRDSTSSRLLPGSSYSCCIRNLHALVHKQCHPVPS
jgi:hypothetical protein